MIIYSRPFLDELIDMLIARSIRRWTVDCVVLCSVVESQFTALLEQTEKEESVPQAVRHYLHEMAELTELAKERLDQVKVE